MPAPENLQPVVPGEPAIAPAPDQEPAQELDQEHDQEPAPVLAVMTQPAANKSGRAYLSESGWVLP